jgi:hypothetical protein
MKWVINLQLVHKPKRILITPSPTHGLSLEIFSIHILENKSKPYNINNMEKKKYILLLYANTTTKSLDNIALLMGIANLESL